MIITVDFKPRNYASLAAHLENALEKASTNAKRLTQRDDLDEYSAGLLREYEKNIAVIKQVMADLYSVDIEDV